MAEDFKSQLRDYWRNFKRVFPKKSVEEGKERTRRWAMELKKELKLDKEIEENWERYVAEWLEELEKEWPEW